MILAYGQDGVFARPARVRRTAFESPRDRHAPVCYETRVRSGNVEIRIATD